MTHKANLALFLNLIGDATVLRTISLSRYNFEVFRLKHENFALIRAGPLFCHPASQAKISRVEEVVYLRRQKHVIFSILMVEMT